MCHSHTGMKAPKKTNQYTQFTISRFNQIHNNNLDSICLDNSTLKFKFSKSMSRLIAYIDLVITVTKEMSLDEALIVLTICRYVLKVMLLDLQTKTND